MVRAFSGWRRRVVVPAALMSLLLTPALASSAEPAPDDPTAAVAEADPNAPRDSAVPLVLGDLSGVAGAIDPAGDNDWYVFSAPEVGRYHVEFFEAGPSFWLRAEAYSGSTLVTRSVEGDGIVLRRVLVDVSIPGEYHVRAHGYNSSDRGAYRVRVLPQYDQGLSWQPNGEPDGSRMLAPEVQLGRANAVDRVIEPVPSGFGRAGGDRDYIRFHASRPGIYTVEAFDSKVDLSLNAYDSGGAHMADGVQGSGVVERYVQLNVSIPGDYFVSARPSLASGSGAYKIRVLPQYDQGLTWSTAHESNNNRMTGFSLTPAVNVGSALEPRRTEFFDRSDVDWFNIPVKVGSEHVFTVKPTGPRVEMAVYDQAGKRHDYTYCSPGSTCTISTTPTLAGDYHVRVSPRVSGESGTYTVCARYAGQTCADPSDGITRLAGENRYATAAQVARQFPANVDVAYIADGSNFPDALAGAARAGSLNAPVLLTQAARIPSATAAELARLKPQRIVVLGGKTAVSDAVLGDLRQYAQDSGSGAVTRVAGANRFETAARLSAQYTPGVATAYVATGRAYPDALSGAALAASTNSPVLLVDTNNIPSSVVTELKRLKPQRIVLLGGTGAVSSSVSTELAKYATASTSKVTRIAGDNRYATSAAVAARFPVGVSGAYLATGTAFPDALSGAALAGMRNSPVLLSQADSIPSAVRTELSRLQPKHGYLIGSTGALSNNVRTQLKPYIQLP